MPAPVDIKDFEVELPAGGVMHLQTPDEVELWESAVERYSTEYTFQKHNDKVTLGLLLQQQVVLFRAQTAINGMEPEIDAGGVPTGSYKRVQIDAGEMAAHQKAMNTASAEMRNLEKQLGIDKATREQGGAHTVDNYLKMLKKAAHERGIHISRRTLEYERVINETRWKLRMLFTADAEDRSYHNITPKSVLEWLREECDKLEEVDKTFNKEKGKLFVGQL